MDVEICNSTHTVITEANGRAVQCSGGNVLIQENATGTLLTITPASVKEVFGFRIFETLGLTLDSESSLSSSNGTDVDNNNVAVDALVDTSGTSKKILWNRNAILRLIYLYSKNEEKFKSTTIKNEDVYKIISEESKKKGYSFSSTQCRDKFKYLRLKYMKVVDSKKTTGAGKVHFEFFDEMDAIFGKKPTAHPTAVGSSIREYSGEDPEPTDHVLHENEDVAKHETPRKKGKTFKDDVAERRHQERLARQDKALSYFERYLNLLEHKLSTAGGGAHDVI